MERLTGIQANVLAYLRDRIDCGEPIPTYRELCARFHWASTGTARDHLRALARKGYVELSGGRARHLRLQVDRAPVTSVPIVGTVSAGIPVAAEQNSAGQLPVPANWARRGKHFAVRVDGDSMKNAGIFKGDHVVVRLQSVADQGDVVVATVGGETTVKRLAKRGKRMFLVPENPAYPEIEVKHDPAMIHGVVVGLLRAYRNAPKGGNDAYRT